MPAKLPSRAARSLACLALALGVGSCAESAPSPAGVPLPVDPPLITVDHLFPSMDFDGHGSLLRG